jgi:hypothetical protein
MTLIMVFRELFSAVLAGINPWARQEVRLRQHDLLQLTRPRTIPVPRGTAQGPFPGVPRTA